jgi:hypothetical protein
LSDIRDHYENKKKLLQKKAATEGDSENKLNSKKKKMNNVKEKSGSIINTSEILKKVEEGEMKLEAHIKEVLSIPVKEINNDDEKLNSPREDNKDRPNIKNEGGSKKTLGSNSEKKIKTEKVINFNKFKIL